MESIDKPDPPEPDPDPAGGGDLPMHRNPVNGYRLFKRTDLDKLLKKAAKPVIASASKKPR